MCHSVCLHTTFSASQVIPNRDETEVQQLRIIAVSGKERAISPLAGTIQDSRKQFWLKLKLAPATEMLLPTQRREAGSVGQFAARCPFP